MFNVQFFLYGAWWCYAIGLGGVYWFRVLGLGFWGHLGLRVLGAFKV